MKHLKDIFLFKVLQMIGRAGRPQFDTSATAVIMTTRGKKEHYEKLISGSNPIESGMLRFIREHLNTEIVAGTINDVSQAFDWMR